MFFPPGIKTYIEPSDVIEGYLRKLKSSGFESLPQDLVYTPIAYQYLQDFLNSHIQKELPTLYPNTKFLLMKGDILFFSGLPTAPATCMILEEIIALGIKQIVFVGLAGGLKHVKIGDRLIVNEAVRLEGTSFHYVPREEISTPSTYLTEKIEQYYQTRRIDYYLGKICTTDAPFRETHELIDQLRKDDVLAIEMEISALFSLAKFRGIDASALVIISDELKDNKWSKFQRNLFSDIFLKANLEAIEFLASMM